MGLKSSVVKKAKRFLELKQYLGYLSGIAIGIESIAPVHEEGHAVVARLLGKDTKITLNYSEGGRFYTEINNLYENSPSFPLVVAAGVAANYGAAIITAIISRKISREKDPVLKAGIVGFSNMQAMNPPVYAIMNYLSRSLNGDFEKLSVAGMPYYVTIPLTLAASVGIIAYGLWDLRERESTIKNVLAEKYFLENLGRKEIRNKTRRKREKTIQDLETYFRGRGYQTPRHLKNLYKFSGEERIKIKARTSCRKLERSRLENRDEKDLKFLERDIERFSSYTGMSKEESIEMFKKFYFV